MFSQPTICSNCGAMRGANAAFCGNCGMSVASYQQGVRVGEAKRNLHIIVGISVLIGLIGVVYLLLSLRSSPENRNAMVVNSYATNSSRSLVKSDGAEPDDGKLTNTKVENAVSRLLGNLSVGGSVTVEGIQEQSQQNSATADLRFNGFQYKADMAGTPLSKDRQAPKRPDVNDPNFYDEVYKHGTQQVQTRTYSGRGTAILKRYNDGRWVLKEVRWEFNGWGGTVDIE